MKKRKIKGKGKSKENERKVWKMKVNDRKMKRNGMTHRVKYSLNRKFQYNVSIEFF